MIELFGLIAGLVGDVHAELGEEVLVHSRQDDGRVRFAATQLVKLVDGKLNEGICHGAN